MSSGTAEPPAAKVEGDQEQPEAGAKCGAPSVVPQPADPGQQQQQSSQGVGHAGNVCGDVVSDGDADEEEEAVGTSGPAMPVAGGVKKHTRGRRRSKAVSQAFKFCVDDWHACTGKGSVDVMSPLLECCSGGLIFYLYSS